jgi:FlaG/FlaF family flagellin (archaellin)
MTFKKYLFITGSKKRGLSQIIGTMLMLAMVVPVGTIIVTKGLNEIGEINNRLSSGVTFQNEGGQEDIVFEHVRFTPTGNQVTLTLRNVGTVESAITKVTMVKTDTQEVLINNNDISIYAQPRVGTSISVPANLQFTAKWNDPNYVSSEYKISILTEKGNFFEIVARPFNT